jgi:hypothetical protein
MSQTIFRDPKIGLCQLHILQSSTPASQFQRAATFTRQAVKDGADIVVFPEMAVGFAPDAYATMDERARFSEACTRELVNFQALARVCWNSFSEYSKILNCFSYMFLGTVRQHCSRQHERSDLRC